MKRHWGATIIAIVTTTVVGGVVATSAQRAGAQRKPATRTLLLSCAVAQSATMEISVDERGHVIAAAGAKGDEPFVAAAVQLVLNELRPPVPPPGLCDSAGQFTETITVSCTPPGIMPPPPPSPRPAPVRIVGSLPPPHRWLHVAPVYPRAAREAGVKGTVILELVVGTDGVPGSAGGLKGADGVRVLRSVPGLDEAAIYAARQWRYDPFFLNGVAVPFIITAAVKFPGGPSN